MNYNIVIKNLRIKNSYTQQQIATYLNICKKTYKNYELGNTRTPINILVKLAQLYNVDINYICGISSIANAYPKEQIKK